MDFSSMLRPEFRCACGQIHRCDTRAIYVGKNALSKLPEYLSGALHALILPCRNAPPEISPRAPGRSAGTARAKNEFSTYKLFIMRRKAPDSRSRPELCYSVKTRGTGYQS